MGMLIMYKVSYAYLININVHACKRPQTHSLTTQIPKHPEHPNHHHIHTHARTHTPKTLYSGRQINFLSHM